MSPALALWNRLERMPFGKSAFSGIICWKAPYFGSIRPRFEEFRPGYCIATLRHRRAVTNHIGTVHAIALCNLAELCAGVMTDASLPKGMRWIPKGMTVQYLKKAVGTQRGVATPLVPIVSSEAGYDLPVNVDVFDPAGEKVFNAVITMWVSPKR